MNFQGVVVNVADIDRSIAFYREVLGFTLLSQKDQLAALRTPGTDRTQVIVLRALGVSPHEGSGHIGLRAFVLEVDSGEQLERIAAELDSRRVPVARRAHEKWTAVVGRDPDGLAFVVTHVTDSAGTDEDSWTTLDDFLYGIGE
jgi:catechol 2,3-dioxygenase-like lactoylglutathione lyase family enzyme